MKYYTTDEVAVVCRVTKETVRDWCRDGKIKATKRGRSYLISEDDLKDYLEVQHG